MADSLDTGSEDLLARIEGPVAILTMNRPERRNALSTGMLEGLARALDSCETNASVRAVVLTGAGQGFCAGGDIKGMAEKPAASFDEALHGQRMSEKATSGKIYRMPKPVIASLPGAAAGAGMGLAMACDMRIMADTAVMTTAFTKVGFSGDYGLPWLLSQQVGRSRALELFYLSDKLSAAQCLELGLTNRVVRGAELSDATMALANQLANGPSVAYRYVKENINAAFAQSLEDHIDGEVMRHLTAARTEDHREAVAAFLEKRGPRFKGR